jgi:hypothetical protein
VPRAWPADLKLVFVGPERKPAPDPQGESEPGTLGVRKVAQNDRWPDGNLGETAN